MLHEDVIRLGALALRFGRVNRSTFHEDGIRPETDSDHTVMLGLVACSLAAKLRPYLSTSRIAEFAVVHDLVEAYAGDTQSFGLSDWGKAAKWVREEAALKRISQEFACFPWIEQTIREYEAQKEPSARWVRYLDKCLPKITHRLNGYVNAGPSAPALRDQQIADLQEQYPEFPEVSELLTTLSRP